MTIKSSPVSRLPFGARSFFGPSARLFDKEGDGAPGGAGAAGDPPTPTFTDEQQKAVAAIVNSALSSRLPKMLESTLGPALAPLAEQLKAISAAKTPEPKDDDKGKGPKQADPEFERMRIELEEIKRKNQANEERATAAEAKSKTDRAMAHLEAAYGEKTGSPALAHVLAVAAMAEGKVDYDEQGNPLLKSTRPIFPGSKQTEEILLSVADAVENWSKSTEADPFVRPPTAVKGSPVGGSLRSKVNTGTTPLKLHDPGSRISDVEAQIRADMKAKGLELPE